MAVFTINSINYIVGGNTEKFINLDLKDENGNEIRNKSFVTDESTNMYTDISVDSNTHRMFINDSAETSRPVFNALFDFKDVAVKSDYYKADNTAVFGPKLLKDPLGFVQSLNGNAYGMTDGERESSIIAFTNFGDNRNSRLNGYSNSITWQYRLSSPGDLTYTYLKLEDMIISKKEVISGEISAIEETAKSIEEWLIRNYGELSSTTGIQTLLNPEYNNIGLERSFLYHIMVSNKKSSSDKWNEFNLGNIYGNVFLAKNFYDSKYSTTISNNNITVRKYNRIGETGGHPFLTYYDNWNLSVENSIENDDLPVKKIQAGTIVKNTDSNARKYQHVETVDSLNRFLNRGNHKSNLYSIRLNLDLDSIKDKCTTEEERKKMEMLLGTVKVDIKNSIRRIASSLAPAHTQLFKVYIDKE